MPKRRETLDPSPFHAPATASGGPRGKGCSKQSLTPTGRMPSFQFSSWAAAAACLADPRARGPRERVGLARRYGASVMLVPARLQPPPRPARLQPPPNLEAHHDCRRNGTGAPGRCRHELQVKVLSRVTGLWWHRHLANDISRRCQHSIPIPNDETHGHGSI